MTDLLSQMRRDWDRRALEDAERFVYSRDRSTDEADFYSSGRLNYRQFLQPYLPILLSSRSPRDCRVLEIGCGLGRLTRPLAESFAQVDAVDISPEMIARARRTLAGLPNAHLHLTSGADLAPFPDHAFDLVFSYIVFQHIPSQDIIASYLREAARVLKPGGWLKFQVQGAATSVAPDTWHGVTVSLEEARRMLEDAGLSLVAHDGAGTQYFFLTARRGAAFDHDPPYSYLFPGETWAAPQLLDGWRDYPDNASWRAVYPRCSCLLRVPAGPRPRFFAGLYFRPDDPFPPLTLTVTCNETPLGSYLASTGADHDLEFDLPAPCLSPTARLTLTVDPPCPADLGPAVRCLGLTCPAL